jgi:hypothetical protein
MNEEREIRYEDIKHINSNIENHAELLRLLEVLFKHERNTKVFMSVLETHVRVDRNCFQQFILREERELRTVIENYGVKVPELDIRHGRDASIEEEKQ